MCIHHWDINSNQFGVCRKCGEQKQFRKDLIPIRFDFDTVWFSSRNIIQEANPEIRGPKIGAYVSQGSRGWYE